MLIAEKSRQQGIGFPALQQQRAHVLPEDVQRPKIMRIRHVNLYHAYRCREFTISAYA